MARKYAARGGRTRRVLARQHSIKALIALVGAGGGRPVLSGTGVFAGCHATLTPRSFPWTLGASYDSGARQYALAITGVDVEVAGITLAPS